MTLRLNGSTSGYTEIDAPAVAGSNMLVLPTGNGTAGNILGTDGSGNLSWVNGRMVQGTAQNSTSGTSIDFTGIPSWVKRITVMFRSLSTTGTSIIQIQLGTASGFISTGYLGAVDTTIGGVSAAVFTTGLALTRSGAAIAAGSKHGIATFVSMGGNFWSGTQTNGGSETGGSVSIAGCSVDLAATLTQLRITTVNGTDTFDSGSINILYEG